MTRILTRTACLLTSVVTLMGIVPASALANNAGQSNPDHAARQITDTTVRDRKWALRLPQEDKVEYRGVVSLDRAGAQGGSMMYPAPSAAGLLVAIVTHAALVETTKSSQKNRLQESADKVLAPYRGILDGFSHKDLLARSLGKLSMENNVKLIGFEDKADAEWVIEAAPVFFVAPDQSALILDNSVVIAPPGASPDDKRRTSTRVISYPRNEPDPKSYWIADQGAKIKEESASLFAQSLEIALSAPSAVADENTNPFKTIRYLEGGAEKIERAQIISEGCDRMVIRNLRGTIMSVPINPNSRAGANSPQCNTAPAALLPRE